MARTFEDFRVEDGKVYQVRRDNEKAFFAQQDHRRHQVEAGAVNTNYRRLRFSIPATVQLAIIKQYGHDMDPARYGKMTEQEKRRFDSIIRTQYPRCAMDWGQKYHQGGL